MLMFVARAFSVSSAYLLTRVSVSLIKSLLRMSHFRTFCTIRLYIFWIFLFSLLQIPKTLSFDDHSKHSLSSPVSFVAIISDSF